jgi:hypothetical protein
MEERAHEGTCSMELTQWSASAGEGHFSDRFLQDMD